MVKEQANLSTHLLLWIKEEWERVREWAEAQSKAEQCQTVQIKTEKTFTELNWNDHDKDQSQLRLEKEEIKDVKACGELP